jgi:hypothetical protein
VKSGTPLVALLVLVGATLTPVEAVTGVVMTRSYAWMSIVPLCRRGA